jgi:membrane protease YdiL (CAAX protease family)
MKRPIFLFLFFTFLFSSLFYAAIIHTGKLGSGGGLFVTGLMWCPALSAFITSLILKRPIAGLAWGWGNPKYQWWSYLTPLLYSTVAYLIIWLTGWGGFYNTETVHSIAEAFGFPHMSGPLAIFLYFLLYGVFSLTRSMATAAGEEIGWRGFLVPELYKVTGYTQTSLITGVIWAAWHVPILVFADYNSGTPIWYGLSCFAVLVISISFIFTWFRLKSNSLWTGVLLHASHNLFIQGFFTPLTIDTGKTNYFYDEFGVVLPCVTVLLAVYFWSRRGELPTSLDSDLAATII